MTDVDLWNREIELKIGDLLITNDQLDIDFSIKAGNSSDANTAEISVWNLAAATKAAIKSDQKVRLKAGHTGDNGEIFIGIVKKSWDERDQGDIRTRITALNQVYATGKPSVVYRKGAGLSTIIADAFNASEIPIGKINDQGFVLEEDFTSDPSAFTNLGYCQKKINGSDKTHKEAKFYVEGGKGYFVTVDFFGRGEKIVLSCETGLSETVPEEPDDGSYSRSIVSLLKWPVTTDSVIELKSLSPGASGTYKVVEYTHTCDATEYQTEMKVKPL